MKDKQHSCLWAVLCPTCFFLLSWSFLIGLCLLSLLRTFSFDAGYNASLDPSIDNFFSTAAYRYGHTTIGDVIMRLGEDWTVHPKGHMTLARAWYNPDMALEAGLEPLLRGLIAQPQGKVEPRWSSSVAGGLFGESTVNGEEPHNRATGCRLSRVAEDPQTILIGTAVLVLVCVCEGAP